MRRSSVATALAAGMVVSGLTAAPAAAAPGDPAPGWPITRYEVMPRDVDISGSGRVFDVGLPDLGILDHSLLEHGVGEDWHSIEVPPRSTGGVVAGSGDYAVAVTGNVSRVFDGTSWGDPVQIAGEIWRSKLVGNTKGDAAMLWNAGGEGVFLSRLKRGGAWETSRVTGLPARVPRDVVINDEGKTTVVWAAPNSETTVIRRSVLQRRSTTWTPAVQVGTVSLPRPRIAIVTDGQGRETLLAASKLWRQTVTSKLPVYQFRTSGRPVLATGHDGTRLTWATKSDGRYRLHTRFVNSNWRAESVIWSHPVPFWPDCDRGIEFGVGMVPGGRSFVAVGIRHDIDDINLVCEGVEIADFLAVDQSNDVLNERQLGYYSNGGPFQVDAAARGPVVLTYEYEDDGVGWGGEPPADGFWHMRFFSR